MLVITQDAENYFKSEIDQCEKRKESWRCILLDLSEIQNKPQDWFLQVCEKIRSCFGDDGGKIFLFEGSDVYILTRHGSQKSLSYLVNHLSSLFPNTEIEPLASIFELPVHANVLRSIRDEKILEMCGWGLNIDMIERQITHLKNNAKINIQDLHATLPDRRRRRDKTCILLVEDDPFSQKLVSKVLGEKYNIVTADDGKSALEKYIYHAPDMIFLDIGLPDASGIDLVSKILRTDPDAFIVMLSGYGSKDTIVRAVQAGASGFVAKPFTQEKLFQYAEKSPFIIEKTTRSFVHGF